MRNAVRAVAVAAPALVVVAAAWLRLEQPVASLWRVLVLVALGLAAAAPRSRRLRLAGAVVATIAAARIAVGVDLVPWRIHDPGSGFGFAHGLSAVGTRFGNGLSDFYGTHLPFDPRFHVAMGELVLAAVFAFSLAVALLAAERRPVAAALALLVGAGWPATLIGPAHGIAMGVAILGAALVLLAGLGSRRVPALALPAVAVVAAGAVAVGSATASRHGLVHWQSWNLTHAVSGSANVGFVWNAQYGGLHWPSRSTVVLQVRSAHAPSYLRAAVLDDFSSDAWATGLLRPADSLEPAAAFRARNQTSEVVTVEGLVDNRLVGGSIPVRFTTGAAPVAQPEPGFAAFDRTLPRGFTYTAWSYAARPTAAELDRAAPAYPSRLTEDGLLDVGGGVSMPTFGVPDRVAAARAVLARNPQLNSYLPLARLAEEKAGGARTPYRAVARLEDWFLHSGGFRYSNQPPVIGPPLVGFVTQTRTGYCQFYAGAMALMLRYLGIPARVAVGFAGGTYSRSRSAWLVTDHDAHAWVEVWFDGYGWLPFDPTPAAPGAAPRPAGNGANPAAAVGAAPYADAPAVSPTKGLSLVERAQLIKNGLFPRRKGSGSAAAAGLSGGGGVDGRAWAGLALLLLVAVAGAGIVVAKTGVRLVRGTRRDPRGIAAACREDLAAFLVDQRIEPPHSATLAELGELARRELGVEPGPFVAAATAARFGPAESAERAAQTARHELRRLLDAARRGLTWRERLRGLLSLRSLTRSASPLGSGAVEGAAV